MKKRLVCLSMAVLLGVSLHTTVNVNAATVTIDNDGKARDTPYGDSKLPTSYSDTDYYDCYLPYALTPSDIGGYSTGVTAYRVKDYDECMANDNKQALDKPFTSTCMYEFDKNGSTLDGCNITKEGKLNIVTDANGNQYYITAIQGFFYNFGGLDIAQGKDFFEWDDERGQVFDVILTDGTCIHFAVGDENAIGHTNGGPETSQDVTYTFSDLKLPQYKNLFHATNANCLELWGSKGCTTEFKDKYNLKSDGNQIAYYRMYNKKLSDAPMRANGVGTSVAYSMGDATISANSSNSSSSDDSNLLQHSSLVSEWELQGMPEKSRLADFRENISMPTREGLTISETNNLEVVGGNISTYKQAISFDRARVFLVFIGLCLLVYAILLIVAMLFDNVNSFIDLSAVSVLTLGKLMYAPNEKDLGKKKGLTNTKKLSISIIVLIILGMFLVSGSIFPIMWKFVFGVSQIF